MTEETAVLPEKQLRCPYPAFGIATDNGDAVRPNRSDLPISLRSAKRNAFHDGGGASK